MQGWAGVAAASFLTLLTSTVTQAQDPLENAPLAPQSSGVAAASDNSRSDGSKKTDKTARTKSEPEFIVKSDAEWRKILTRAQFAVTRQKATEPAFSGKYATGHFRGAFLCVCCDAARVETELFSSRHKFDSGTGWPSFYQAVNEKAIAKAWDYSEFEPRVEVMCRRCGAHLGHVFDDGPPPTGLRFCINSAAIKLKSPISEPRPKPAATKTTSKSRFNTKINPSANSAPKATVPKDSSSPADPNRTPTTDPGKGALSLDRPASVRGSE